SDLTRVTPARPTDKRRAHGASSPLFRERPTKRASRASSQRPSTKGVRVSSRRSESSSASSVSPYDARRRGATSHPSSHSQPVSPWSNPSTQPSVLSIRDTSEQGDHNMKSWKSWLLAGVFGAALAGAAQAQDNFFVYVSPDPIGVNAFLKM